ncbi:cellulase family glycosylhydrolase [Rhizobium azibense]|uniref:cellulase family glycosylhydrolase n=1 Tax=Rhizobium azibense TaxID=1136135 RepID=UPI0010464482|nr:cellulase family glycosylhydrolase [Rhizobium azibense]
MLETDSEANHAFHSTKGHDLKIGRRGFLIGSSSFAANALLADAAKAATFEVGVGAHLWSASRSEIDKVVKAVRDNGFKLVRWDAPWKGVELTKGRLEIPPAWDYAVEAIRSVGAENILILDYGNKYYVGGDKPTTATARSAFVIYAEAVAKHFKGRVARYEVWNEWDTKNGETSYQPIEHYVSLVKACYPALKAVDPSVQVMAGNFSSITYERSFLNPFATNYFRDFLASDVGRYMDGFSIHPYVRGLPVEKIPSAMDAFFGRIEGAIHGSPGFEGKPILVTEIGWKAGVQGQQAVSEDQQANLLAEAIKLSKKYRFHGLCIYEIKDGGEDFGYGIYDKDWTPKAAAGRVFGKLN